MRKQVAVEPVVIPGSGLGGFSPDHGFRKLGRVHSEDLDLALVGSPTAGLQNAAARVLPVPAMKPAPALR
jgi:hypothetical protein